MCIFSFEIMMLLLYCYDMIHKMLNLNNIFPKAWLVGK